MSKDEQMQQGFLQLPPASADNSKAASDWNADATFPLTLLLTLDVEQTAKFWLCAGRPASPLHHYR